MKTREPFLFSLLKVLFLCTDCANILGTCEKNVALCTDSAYLNLMKQYCKQTCGYCGNGTIFKPSSQPHLFSSFDHNSTPSFNLKLQQKQPRQRQQRPQHLQLQLVTLKSLIILHRMQK